ncbi:peptidyl-prolyl cis-trans isomerase sig-7 [Anoplophora glabripennis]|uniref:peptidyl-prolyl cis-trans isomerase sig-7 n=1 Tax=Anoplophora glabripennis TaxID=217634 RepID=UPI000873D690|nr:peptidyl-prolyl cis-trans isomerase sig-7 [Anoplophora glabripennis]
MSVVIETTLGDITVDLFTNDRPRACLNFLKLCKIKYYNYNLFHTISRSFIAQTGDPSGSRSGGESIYGVLYGSQKRYFEGENEPRIKHTKMGLLSFVGNEDRMIGSQFFLTLGDDLTYLDEKHCVFGEVVEGFDILEVINEVICDTDDRPYQDVRITHTVILDDPFPDPKKLVISSRSPSPSAERLKGGRIAPDEEIDELEGKTPQEIAEMQAEREAKARATILEMVGDLPDAETAPPENVLFVCKLNPVTNDDDLEIIFSRFGKIKSCEVIRDKKTGDSLQYAFVEFEDKSACENAYFKMDNVLIDDRRIHVDFSQSVSKVKWRGKGRGVTHYDEKGKKSENIDSDIGKGNYKHRKNDISYKNNENRPRKNAERSNSPIVHKSNRRYERERSLTPKRNNSNYVKEYLKKSRYSRKQKSPSLSPERKRRYSKSPIIDRSKNKYNSQINKDKSDDPKSRNKKEIGERYSSSKSRGRSRSPRQKYRDAETGTKNKSKSVSPKRLHSKSYKQYKSDKYDKSVKSRTSPERGSHSHKKKHISKDKTTSNSDSSSSDKYEKTEKYVEKSQSSIIKALDKSKSRYSPESKNYSSRERSSTKDKYTREYESGQENEKKKRKNKKKKSKYSSSEESDSDNRRNKKKKPIETESSDSDYKKSKAKKKKSVKKSKHHDHDSSSDSDNYKKKTKQKKKCESDSD